MLRNFRDRTANCEQAVVLEDHHVLGPEISHDTLALAKIERHFFIIVLRDIAVEAHRFLVQWQQFLSLRSKRRFRGARVNCALRVITATTAK